MIKNESCVQQHFSVYSISWIICHSNIHRRDNVAISVGCWWDVFVNHFLHTPNAASRLCTAITAAQTLLQLYLSIIRHSLTWGLISHKSEKNSWILYIHCILCSPKHWPCWWNSFIAGILLHVKYFFTSGFTFHHNNNRMRWWLVVFLPNASSSHDNSDEWDAISNHYGSQ